MLATFAYIPFVNPINLFHEWWYLLLVPLAFGISVIYKAVRLPALEQYWRQVLVMTLQIVLGMIGLAIVVVVIVLTIPHLPAE